MLFSVGPPNDDAAVLEVLCLIVGDERARAQIYWTSTVAGQSGLSFTPFSRPYSEVPGFP